MVLVLLLGCSEDVPQLAHVLTPFKGGKEQLAGAAGDAEGGMVLLRIQLMNPKLVLERCKDKMPGSILNAAMHELGSLETSTQDSDTAQMIPNMWDFNRFQVYGSVVDWCTASIWPRHV